MPLTSPAHNRVLLSPWLPAGVWILFLALAAALWVSAQYDECEQKQQLLTNESHLAAEAFSRSFQEQLRALQRMAARHAAAPDMPEARWRSDAQIYIKHNKNFQALEWIDRNNIIRWAEPLAGNEVAINFNVAFNEARRVALGRAARTGETDFSGVITLQQGGLGLVVYFPIGQGEDFNGFIAAVFRLEPLLTSQLSAESRRNFRWRLLENGHDRFQLTPDNPTNSTYTHTQAIEVLGLNWSLEATPTQVWVDQYNSHLGLIIFITLALTGSLLSGAVRIGQIAMHRQHDLLLARLALQEETSQRKAIEASLEHLSSNDPLTGLVNRRFFMEDLHQILLQAERKQQQVALIILDLDGFQTLNDTHGHEFGDALLALVAQRLTRLDNETITIGHSSADEFMLSLQNIQRLDDVIDLLDQVARCLKKPFIVLGQPHEIGGTCGVAIFPESGNNASLLLRNADTALFRAKETSRGSYQFYTEGMHEQARQRLALDKSMRRALVENEFVLFMQPQLDLATGQVGSVEALIRWMHPQQGLLPPVKFIPAAIESGLITEIGRWVIRAACRQLALWSNGEFGHLRIAVNLSGRELDSPDLVGYVARTLSDNNIEPGRMELELTEEIFVQNIDCNLEQLTRLSAMGVHLAIDDFGVGYSSLSYLKNFPVNLLKIDRSFITNVVERHDDAVITRAVINLAHNLGIQVTAEGIETEAQLNFLRSHRCDFIQGYLIGKPMPVKELEQKIRSGSMNRKI